MPFFRPVKTKKRSKHYDKLSHKCKLMLLKKVICDRIEIKQSAEQLQINYSTAKTLLRKYKYHGYQINSQVLQGICQWFAIYDVERQRSQYKFIDVNDDAVKVECDSAEIQLRKKQSKQQVEKVQHVPRQAATPVQIFQQVLFKD